MRRGSVVLFREPNTPASKSRPCIVVQADAALDEPTKITAVPLTGTLRQIPDLRPLVGPTPQNGLKHVCEAEVDWVFTFRCDFLGPVIGEMDEATMDAVDCALRLWLDL